MGIKIDESVKNPGKFGPYQQTKKLKRYQELAYKLLEEGKAYRCFCTKEELDKNREAAILNYCKVPRTREEIQNYIGIKDRKHFREYILKPLLVSNKLNMTIPDKPNSKLQKYISKHNKNRS